MTADKTLADVEPRLIAALRVLIDEYGAEGVRRTVVLMQQEMVGWVDEVDGPLGALLDGVEIPAAVTDARLIVSADAARKLADQDQRDNPRGHPCRNCGRYYDAHRGEVGIDTCEGWR